MKDWWTIRTGALLLGGALGLYLPSSLRFVFIGLALLLALRLWFWRPHDYLGQLYKPELLILVFTLLAGGIYSVQGLSALAPPLEIKNMKVIGQLLDWNESEDNVRGIIRLIDYEMTEELELKPQLGDKYRLIVYKDQDGYLPGGWEQARPGDHIAFNARLEQPAPPGTPGGFDYQIYYAVRGLSGTVTAKGEADIEKVGYPPLFWLIRNHVTESLKTWDSQDTGVLEGILFGDSTKIPAPVLEQYKVTGVLHVFAASGSNVAFVMLLVWTITFLFPHKVRTLLCMGALIFYAALCGGNPPIVRATIMGLAVLAGRLFKERISPLRWLMFAAVGLFAVKPLVLSDIGFQLSFMATWGIIVLMPRLSYLKGIKNLPLFLRVPLTSTLASQMATLPFLIYAFHRLSIIGIVANVLVLGIIGAVLQLSLIGVMISPLSAFSLPLMQTALWLIQFTDRILTVLANIPWADVWVVNPGWSFWLIWYGSIGVWLFGPEKLEFMLRVRWNKFFKKAQMPSWHQLGLIAVLILILTNSPFSGSGKLELTMIDVGQGDAFLLKTPENKALLIDTGPRTDNHDTGERVIIPYLLEQGVKKLEGLIITHEDMDHIGGAQAILKNVFVGWIGVPNVGHRIFNEEWESGIPLNLRHNIKMHMLESGDEIILDSGVWIEVVAPVELLENTRSDSNNNSLVLKIHYEGQSILLTGDMEEEEMESIRRAGLNIDADVFKQPHHGSKFSHVPEWMNLLNPKGVLISVGKNSFGHPAPAIIDYWTNRGVPIYRTDRDGSVKVVIDRKKMVILTGR